MVSLFGDYDGRLPVLIRRPCRGLRVYRGDGPVCRSGTGNQARYPKSKYCGGHIGGVELHPGRALFHETFLALGCGFHPFGILGCLPKTTESPIAPVVVIGSLGVGTSFPYSPERGACFL